MEVSLFQNTAYIAPWIQLLSTKYLATNTYLLTSPRSCLGWLHRSLWRSHHPGSDCYQIHDRWYAPARGDSGSSTQEILRHCSRRGSRKNGTNRRPVWSRQGSAEDQVGPHLSPQSQSANGLFWCQWAGHISDLHSWTDDRRTNSFHFVFYEWGHITENSRMA